MDEYVQLLTQTSTQTREVWAKSNKAGKSFWEYEIIWLVYARKESLKGTQ